MAAGEPVRLLWDSPGKHQMSTGAASHGRRLRLPLGCLLLTWRVAAHERTSGLHACACNAHNYNYLRKCLKRCC